MKNKELKENNIDNKYGIEYTKVGDYYMPNLVLEKEEKQEFISKFLESTTVDKDKKGNYKLVNIKLRKTII